MAYSSICLDAYIYFNILVVFAIWNSRCSAGSLIIYACSRGAELDLFFLLFLGGGRQSKMNIFFASYATLVTRLMWHLCWLSRNMAEIWQHLAAVAASDRPRRLLFKKLAMKNSSARRNDISIWKCWALCSTAATVCLSLSGSISVAVSFALWLCLSHLHSRHGRDDSECEKYIARSIFLGFGLTCFVVVVVVAFAMAARPWQTFWHAIYHPELQL